MFPRPKDFPDHVHYEGYWFLEPNQNYSPPAELRRFLDEGRPPLYIGFGSISDKAKSTEITSTVIAALKQSGQRGIIAKGWGALCETTDMDKDILFVDAVPHDWLFPKMAAVIHHGGAGTTAEGFRAGVPSVIIPFANDQFAWGRRVYEIGVGTKPIRRKDLTIEKLTKAISDSQMPVLKKQAKLLGDKIRSENGAEESAKIVTAAINAFAGQSERHAQG